MHCTAVTAAPEWGEALEYNIYALIYMYTHNALALKGSQPCADGNSASFLSSSPRFQSDNGNSIICVMYVGSNE